MITQAEEPPDEGNTYPSRETIAQDVMGTTGYLSQSDHSAPIPDYVHRVIGYARSMFDPQGRVGMTRCIGNWVRVAEDLYGIGGSLGEKMHRLAGELETPEILTSERRTAICNALKEGFAQAGLPPRITPRR